MSKLSKVRRMIDAEYTFYHDDGPFGYMDEGEYDRGYLAGLNKAMEIIDEVIE